MDVDQEIDVGGLDNQQDVDEPRGPPQGVLLDDGESDLDSSNEEIDREDATHDGGSDHGGREDVEGAGGLGEHANANGAADVEGNENPRRADPPPQAAHRRKHGYAAVEVHSNAARVI